MTVAIVADFGLRPDPVAAPRDRHSAGSAVGIVRRTDLSVAGRACAGGVLGEAPRRRQPICPHRRTERRPFQAGVRGGLRGWARGRRLRLPVRGSFGDDQARPDGASEMLPDRPIFIVDSRLASMALGTLALRGAALAASGIGAEEICRRLATLRASVGLYLGLDTLEYLRKGGRISHAKAAIGGLLSIKPIITVEEGLVVVADQPRTRSKATERLLELMAAEPVTELHLLYSPPADIDAFRGAVLAQNARAGPEGRHRPDHRAGHRGPRRAGRVRRHHGPRRSDRAMKASRHLDYRFVRQIRQSRSSER